MGEDSFQVPGEGTAVHIIGATGRSGMALCRSLAAEGVPFVPVIRNPGKWNGVARAPRVADLGDHAALSAALGDAVRIVSCAHARYTPAILAAAPLPARLILLGSTRKFTRWPDAHGQGVLAGEAAFRASGRSGVMLHPTMIYGAQGEDNVKRLAALLRRLPVVPLPGGGKALVQPIHQDDVTAAIRAALRVGWNGPESIVVAGSDQVSYADFVRAVALAAGLARPRFVSVPATVLQAATVGTMLLPFLPRIRSAEVRRLLEDKTFDIGPMLRALQVRPTPLAEGLARTFAPPFNPLPPGAAYADH